jgi:2,3-bisphosphoglycerate-dependent phosphoglycerate mutase
VEPYRQTAGHFDSPLTESGLRQAHALSDGLDGKGIEVIYSSDLGRAMQTATIIAEKLGLEINIDRRLRERHLGTMQGLTKKEFRQQYPDEWAAFDSGDPDYCFPDGESAQQRYERSVACVQELVKLLPDRKALVVTHGGVLNGLFYMAIGIPLSEPRRFSLFNASINSFSMCGDSWRLDTWGEVGHLKGMSILDDN